MRQTARFRPVVTRDGEGLARAEQIGYVDFYRTDETGAELYEIEFLSDGLIMLADRRDLSFI